MERIASFDIDHEKLQRGMYISRVDDDIVTYDIRMRRPNIEQVMDNAAIHTIEHLFATYVRNTQYANNIVYFGPMGCRTGCYFLTRNLDHETAIKLTKEAFEFILNFKGEIPGASSKECGNYKDHNLEDAKEEAKGFLQILSNWEEKSLNYPK